jgi:histidine triad (HIT) family protein
MHEDKPATRRAPLTDPRSSDMQNCVFCSIAAGNSPAVIVREWPDALAIRPRSGGVNDGHAFVLPRVHVEDAGTNPEVTASVMRRAAELMAELPAANLITSKGKEATQSVFHLHVHIVPRTAGDGLLLPWTLQHAARTDDDHAR